MVVSFKVSSDSEKLKESKYEEEKRKKKKEIIFLIIFFTYYFLSSASLEWKKNLRSINFHSHFLVFFTKKMAVKKF